jgi:glyoxylase-like metal-dependent hydrolase (beta-lactamase superfamily II)
MIGDVRVTSLVEYFGPTHPTRFLFPDLPEGVLDANRAWLTPNHWYPQIDRLVIAIQMWIVHAGDRVVLIDAGVGNGKPRTAARMNRLNSLVPEWLAAAGAGFEQVTDVVMTHLHSDHVGWNTIWKDGRWEPAFPNARYFVPRVDFEYFKGRNEVVGPKDGGSFDDSVMPIVNAGLATFVDMQTELLELLRAEPAAGHTPGQMNYWLRSKGEEGVFSADVMHHPLQIVQPHLNSAFCVLPEEARSTRLALLERASASRALVMPCHFGPPHCGYVRSIDGRFEFVPAVDQRATDAQYVR